ncbi:Type II secretory pathway, pseudopilin PulG [Pasteurella skyensis]|uniref:Type II secretory pathway, pseudopilin PulG n=1 Tax=Phocoenobacter skyensis TaxID=97481 RepID=A0AAJ6NAW4_9PAST|nr:Type II secretory pathway, pseudopilin PulG [Pasteurella skyensis]MDP8162684.1 Type II secretory pathway, pseudopilin PulG [Pasteurella skyensis]MDP8173452.1 Type II secretory pathway, pseudopilin PulG [Pasteurella skyensis]MDP8177629.1 Type II secretory pathway, pseudopilin PulG [Pasteurella skyensis]MDP8178786.1 Type II secretory pathway, pseudopilin PulG [Pasteurella skyensis]MDP8183086.1 Type II secretory pathway, pseudopilin PulG [Pasteurella skyensis]
MGNHSILKAITLIETLITLCILVISLYFLSPVIFKLQDNHKLNTEIALVKSFIYQVQTKARYHKKRYSLLLSQDVAKQKWCIIAIKKKTRRRVKCNCLNLSSCAKFDEYLLYKNNIDGSQLNTSLYYPKTFINIDGIAGTLESKCVNISVNQYSEILKFNQYGVVDVIPKNKISRCRYR